MIQIHKIRFGLNLWETRNFLSLLGLPTGALYQYLCLFFFNFVINFGSSNDVT